VQDSCLLAWWLFCCLSLLPRREKGRRKGGTRNLFRKHPLRHLRHRHLSSATPYRPRKLSNPQQLSTTATPNSTWSYRKLRGDEPFDGCGQATAKLSVLACYLLDFCGKERVDNFTSFPRKIRESSKGEKRDRRKRV